MYMYIHVCICVCICVCFCVCICVCVYVWDELHSSPFSSSLSSSWNVPQGQFFHDCEIIVLLVTILAKEHIHDVVYGMCGMCGMGVSYGIIASISFLGVYYFCFLEEKCNKIEIVQR